MGGVSSGEVLKDKYSLEGEEVDMKKLREEALQGEQDSTTQTSQFLKIYKEDKEGLVNADEDQSSQQVRFKRDLEDDSESSINMPGQQKGSNGARPLI